MSEETIIRTMRAMAWERAKGELRSILETYWDEEEKFDKIDAAIKRFTNEVENEGWAE